MKILAVIVTYYPEEDLLKKNLAAFIENVDTVIVWENTPIKDAHRYRFLQQDKIRVLGEGENKGISHALNRAFQIALQEEFTHLLTMDQDSCWIGFSSFLETIKDNNLSGNICAPSIIKKHPESLFYKVPFTITSGCLFPVEMLNAIGGFDEAYFVEHIDMEVCCRAKNWGFDTIIVNTGTLIQRFGVPKRIGRRGQDKFFYSYPIQRHYEIMRNKVRIHRTFNFSYYYTIKVFLSELFKTPIQIALYDDNNKIKKISAIYRGFISGLKVKVRKKYKKCQIC